MKEALSLGGVRYRQKGKLSRRIAGEGWRNWPLEGCF
jgi:hypothetical protein